MKEVHRTLKSWLLLIIITIFFLFFSFLASPFVATMVPDSTAKCFDKIVEIDEMIA